MGDSLGETHNATTELRLDAICTLMRALEWRTGETGLELAAEWGVSKSTIAHLAAEASRRVKAEVTDPDRVTATICVALERMMRDAIGDARGGIMLATESGTKQESPNISRKVAIEAARTWAEVSGAHAPLKLDATMGGTPAELAAKAADAVRTAFRAGHVEPYREPHESSDSAEPSGDPPAA